MKRSEKVLLGATAVGLALITGVMVFQARSQRRLAAIKQRVQAPQIVQIYEALRATPTKSPDTPATSDMSDPQIRSLRERIDSFDRLFRDTAFVANDPEFGDALKSTSEPSSEWPEDMIETLRKIVELTAAHLPEIRELAAQDGPLFAPDFSQGFVMELPHLAPVRTLARLLFADALIAREDGEVARIVDDIDATLGLGDALALEPILISQLVRISIVHTAFEEMRLLPADTLGDDSVDRLLAHLAAAQHREAFAAAYSGEAALVEVVFGGENQYLFDSQTGNSFVDAWEHVYRSPLGQPIRTADEATTLEILGEIEEIGAMPLYEARAAMEAVERRIDSLVPVFHPIGLALLPGLTRASEAQARHEATLDVAQMGLLIEQFQRDTGYFPESLDAVAPLLTDGLPVDPFTGRDYVYRPTEDTFLLYSVGRNLVDDGGLHHMRDGDIVWGGIEEDDRR